LARKARIGTHLWSKRQVSGSFRKATRSSPATTKWTFFPFSCSAHSSQAAALHQILNPKKTEGLELGAVDKLLVGTFVGCDGEEEETCLSHSSPTILFIILLLTYNN
jgi:hypothetical protein